ncbi:MAG: fasciclin domain-containing protein [Chitinophagaceae bacterium]
MKNLFSKLLTAGTAILLLLIFTMGCKKLAIKQTTTDDVNIVGYLDKNLDSFSLFRQILERTETAAFLNAYGAYTVFAPTNSGVRAYLPKIGATSVETADLAVLKDMVRFHLLEDTVTTAAFTDGKLATITMFGQYLITSVADKAGSSTYLINRQAFVLQPNVRVGNGIIHVIDNVLIPPKLTLAKTIEANTNYSIFTQALKETGYFDILNINNNPNPSRKWLTVIAESNQVLADSGINSYAQLKAKYSKTGNPLLITDSLNLYCAYHILNGIKYLGDIIIATSHTTLAPQEVVSSKLQDQQVLINDDVFNGVLEPGITLRRPTSDIASTNGVVHDASAHFTLKYRKPTAVYWDVSDFTEIRKLPAYFRKQSYNFVKATAADFPVVDITWPLGLASGTSTLTYSFSTASSITNYACNADVNILPLGAPNRPFYVDYRTPTIIKGRYKVWMCYRSQKQSTSSNMQCNVEIDGVTMQRPFNFTESRPNGTDGELESIGWKRYIENTSTTWASRLVGTVDILTTERHMLRIVSINGTQNNNNLDMIHFIPVDQDQVLPRFKPDGTKLFL